MKASLKITAVLGAVALLVVAFKPLFHKTEDRNHVLLAVLNQAIRQAHYSNVVYDDNFSSKVFDEYLRTWEYAKRHRLKPDVQELEKYRYLVDKQIKNNNLALFQEGTAIIKMRQQQAEMYYREAIEQDFDFSVKEGIHTNPDSLDYLSSEDELRDYWRRTIKFSVLERMADQIKIQEKAIEIHDTSYKVKARDEMKAEAVKGVRDTYDKWMKRLQKTSNKDYMSYFLNSIIAACDPHSEYLPPDEKTAFDISMSGKFEGIGATLQSKNGQTKVTDIIPGSASWRQGELEVGDIIMKVAQGDNEPVDISNMDLDEAVKMIRGKKGSTVKLTVKKIDGSVKVIPIVRDVVVIEETYAKSSVITSPDGGSKVGYIYLPKFYADFNDRAGRFCSKDVKAELEKLKADGINGVVLDLRNNGGGSLSDVVDMSGLFIKNGPVVQVVDRDNHRRQLEDNDPSVVYDGPVVVLVNNYSASASEILAAALQDYERAIIMGSNSSFGKGTVQTVYDIDRMVLVDSIKPLGALKITISKFYRINGGTTQLQGVIPDIIMPDNYAFMKVGEKELHNPLPFDNTGKASYGVWKHPYKTSKVVSAAKARIDSNPIFKQIVENAKRLKQRSDESYYSLNLDEYIAYQNNIEAEAEKYKDLGKEKTGVKATFVSSDKRNCAGDSVKTNKFTRWFEDLEKDIYLLEAVNVISDMNK
ncbi:MAG: carboxy terminal-processing peptidase [Bacteroidales bacterium]|nr:carboxy terminal-processing peptidase [Bacteroidales bacterium]